MLRLSPAAPVMRRVSDSHPGLLLEEKVASFARRMRWKYCGYFQRLRSCAVRPTRTLAFSSRGRHRRRAMHDLIRGGPCPHGLPCCAEAGREAGSSPIRETDFKTSIIHPRAKRKTSLPERTNRQGRFHRRNGVGKRNYHVAWGEKLRVQSAAERFVCGHENSRLLSDSAYYIMPL